MVEPGNGGRQELRGGVKWQGVAGEKRAQEAWVGGGWGEKNGERHMGLWDVDGERWGGGAVECMGGSRMMRGAEPAEGNRTQQGALAQGGKAHGGGVRVSGMKIVRSHSPPSSTRPVAPPREV